MTSIKNPVQADEWVNEEDHKDQDQPPIDPQPRESQPDPTENNGKEDKK